MKHLFCYRIGAIDDFVGAMSRSELTRLLSVEDSEVLLECIDVIQAFENKAMVEFRRLGWEGDLRQGPFFFVVPVITGMAIGIIYKQDNNGDTFVASPVALPHLAEGKL